jgi:hypothetical protein
MCGIKDPDLLIRCAQSRGIPPALHAKHRSGESSLILVETQTIRLPQTTERT